MLKILFLAASCILPCCVLTAQAPDSTGKPAVPAVMDTLSVLKNSINVYIDCDYCDEANLREELTFVNYVCDRMVADVHILVTREYTGGGGRKFSFFLIGQRKFSTMKDTLSFEALPDATEEFIRQHQRQVIKLGLLRYMAKTPLYKDFTISYSAPEKSNPTVDKWKNWVFNIQLNAYVNAQESTQSRDFYTSLGINKITKDWKVTFGFNNDYYNQKYKFDSTTIESISRSNDFSHLLVRSLSDHWSAGYYINMSNSTYMNTRFGISVAPALEYDVFPYSKSTRKLLTFLYRAGYQRNQYYDSTLYLKKSENLMQESLSVSLTSKQTWGSVSLSLTGSNYMHDFSKNRVSLYTSVEIRIFKGLSLGLYGGANLIHDQLSLPKGDASLEEVLLHQQQLSTQYSYYVSMGISYTFGSIYNNIVNPRFVRSGGSMIYF